LQNLIGNEMKLFDFKFISSLNNAIIAILKNRFTF